MDRDPHRFGLVRLLLNKRHSSPLEGQGIRGTGRSEEGERYPQEGRKRPRSSDSAIFPLVTTTEAHSKHILRLTINGTPWEGAVEPQALLLDVLRYEAGLTGTKRGCDMGTCGCCAVQIEGEPRLSCLTLALDCQGANVRTIEGVQSGPLLTSLQKEWADCGASQCGFCTPGFIMVGEALLESCPQPTEAQVRAAIAGNLCRCTGYVKIVEAFMRATTPVAESDSAS